MKPSFALPLVLVVLPFAAHADSHGNKLVMSSVVKGVDYIMNETHMALYTYKGDSEGVSACYDECARDWPPALLPADAEMPENYTLIPRDDGTMQIAYKGRPLYARTSDKKIGDMTGVEVDDQWVLAVPER